MAIQGLVNYCRHLPIKEGKRANKNEIPFYLATYIVFAIL